MSEGFMMRKVN